MKKKKIKLNLDKQVISRLQQKSVKGGNEIGAAGTTKWWIPGHCKTECSPCIDETLFDCITDTCPLSD